MRLGYACINIELSKSNIQVNRTMVKKTFLEKGIVYASELALQNVLDLAKVIDWNIQNNIKFFRMSSDMFPWMSEYELSDLPDFEKIKSIFKEIGEKVKQFNLRLTFHPGQFNVLASPNKKIVENTIKDLRQHAEIMEMMHLPGSPFAKINIHVGGAYGDKGASLTRFLDNFLTLPEIVRTRLTVENDDKANMFSIRELLRLTEVAKIPLVFDYHHHQFCTGGLTEEEALSLAISTWPSGIDPIVHFSSSRKVYEDHTAHPTSHADYIYNYIKGYGNDIDIMLEAKAKEKAVFKYIEEYKIKPMVEV